MRCGMSSDCAIPDAFNPANWLAYDKPYNWPAHPTVHWGKWDFNFELRMLARKWYQTFGKPLVINDISLPKGGLLDINSNWKSEPPPDGHQTHRKGINADILQVSVPQGVGRPSGPKDKQWEKIYRDYGLFEKRKLRYQDGDYNHLIFTGGIKTSTN